MCLHIVFLCGGGASSYAGGVPFPFVGGGVWLSDGR
jgi:hypothetical protein